MKATLVFYIIVGLLTVVPLILFNVKRVFVKKTPEPLKINWVRGVVILLISVLIVVFLITAYNATLHERYEIAIERAAQEHAEFLLGKQGLDEFREFMIENGTDSIAAAFDATDFGQAADAEMVKFKISDRCNPRYWQKEDYKEYFDQNVPLIDKENPIYVMYLLKYDGKEVYYTMRMVNTDDGWKYDWIGQANEGHIKVIEMPASVDSKWFEVDK